ncbi:MAG: nicotinate (nicotinamide) nucleotide adenylyltransferase [Phycisphaerales bacterium]
MPDTLQHARRYSRLIVYGGSFDPPHRAHVALPFEAAKQVGAAGVVYMPAGQPPHKQGRAITPAHHRLHMLRLALGGREDATICTWEMDRPPGQPNYTVDTLEHLRRELGEDVEMRLLIGADMALIFEQWREPGRIERLAEPLVMLRPPEDADGLLSHFSAESRERWRGRIVVTSQLDISSTDLRHRLSHGLPLEPPDALEPGVLAYIREQGLYSENNNDTGEITKLQ